MDYLALNKQGTISEAYGSRICLCKTEQRQWELGMRYIGYLLPSAQFREIAVTNLIAQRVKLKSRGGATTWKVKKLTSNRNS